MKILAEILEDGTVKVKDPKQWQGKEVHLNSEEIDFDSHPPNGTAILQSFQNADKVDFPRKTHEELMRELHEVRK